MLTKIEKGKIFMLQNGIFLLAALFFAIGLKYHYSLAGSEDLAWILRPTAGLVELLSGIRFEEEAHAGFLSRAHQVIIAPACAGVNFFIVAFCVAVFSGAPRIEPSRLKCMWLAASVIAVYLLTIFVNALRIIVSIYSYEAHLYSGWITSESVHRLEGVFIYFFFLSLFYSIIDKGLRRFSVRTAGGEKVVFQGNGAQASRHRWVLAGSAPLFWYLLVTVAVPLLNGAASDNRIRFAEHSGMVIAGCLIVWVVLLLTCSGWRRIGDRIRRLKH